MEFASGGVVGEGVEWVRPRAGCDLVIPGSADRRAETIQAVPAGVRIELQHPVEDLLLPGFQLHTEHRGDLGSTHTTR